MAISIVFFISHLSKNLKRPKQRNQKPGNYFPPKTPIRLLLKLSFFFLNFQFLLNISTTNNTVRHWNSLIFLRLIVSITSLINQTFILFKKIIAVIKENKGTAQQKNIFSHHHMLIFFTRKNDRPYLEVTTHSVTTFFGKVVGSAVYI